MQGRVKFFRTENCWGLIVDPETNQEYHVHINDIVNRRHLERNQWVSFDVSARKGRKGGLSAVNVVPIECPPQFQFRGRVSRIVADKAFGFIAYERGSIFFHASDVCPIDGLVYWPVEGCTVEFHEGVKVDRVQALYVNILDWPEQSFEEYFESAPDLPLDTRALDVAPQGSVLAPKLRSLPLIEIIRRQREERRA